MGVLVRLDTAETVLQTIVAGYKNLTNTENATEPSSPPPVPSEGEQYAAFIKNQNVSRALPLLPSFCSRPVLTRMTAGQCAESIHFRLDATADILCKVQR